MLPLLYWPLLELLDKTGADLEEPARELTDRADGAIGVILLVLIVGIGAPIVEEIFYRGLLLGALRKRGMPAGWAIAVTALVFGAQPLPAPPAPGTGPVRRRGRRAGGRATTDSGPAIAAHVAFNMVTVIALLAT